MKRRSKIIVASTIVVTLIGGATAFAHRYDRGAHIKEHVSERLSLSDQQQDKLDALFDNVGTIRENMREQRFGLKEDVIALITAPNFDQQKMLDLVNSKTRAIDDYAVEVSAGLAEFLDSLDAAQKTELTDMLDRFGHRKMRH